jgi:hypothetical protein
VRNIAPRHVLKRMLNSSRDAQVISDHIQTVTWSIRSFTVSLLVFPYSITFVLHLKQVESALEIEYSLDVSQSLSGAYA